MKSGLTFISLLILLIAGCKKPKIDLAGVESLPITFTTTLQDTIPANTFYLLHIKNVQGVRMLHLDGADVRYFEYEIEPERLLKALSLSPFSMDALKADTTCRKLEDNMLTEDLFKPAEMSQAFKFIEADENADIYETIKPPLRHLLLINRTTNAVLHRISNF